MLLCAFLFIPGLQTRVEQPEAGARQCAELKVRPLTPCCLCDAQTKVEKNTKQVQARKAKGAKHDVRDDEGGAEDTGPKRWSDYTVSRPSFILTLAVERRASVATATIHPPALNFQDSEGSFGWVLRCACRALHSRPTFTSPRHRKINTRQSFISLQVHFAFPEPAEVPPPLRVYINKPLAEARSFVSVVLQVHFAFPEPTELPPPLIQLNDVSFKYPGRDDFGLEDLNIGIVRPLHPLHCSSIPLNVACHNLLRCPACRAPLGKAGRYLGVTVPARAVAVGVAATAAAAMQVSMGMQTLMGSFDGDASFDQWRSCRTWAAGWRLLDPTAPARPL